MAKYLYVCSECKNRFEVTAPPEEIRGLKPECPKCGSKKTIPFFSGLNSFISSFGSGCCGPSCSCK